MFWLAYRNQDFNAIFAGIKKAKLGWVLLTLLLGMFSHLSRAYRWALLMEPMGYKARKLTVFYSVLIMYLSNFAFPRSGEVVRCGIVSRYEKVPFTGLLGTVLTERIVDMIILLLLTVVVVITQMSVVGDFFRNNPSAKANFQHIVNSKWILIGIIFTIIGIVVMIYLLRNKIKQTALYKKFQKYFEDFGTGIKSLIHLKKKWQFIGNSLFIWLMYWLMLYVIFFAFDFTKHMSLMQAMTILVISSYGMVIPSPGGIGTWHFLAIETLFVFGVSRVDAGVFAIVTHESQTLMLIIIGLLALLSTSFIKVRDSKIEIINKQKILENEEQ
jgi:hypothetical protein